MRNLAYLFVCLLLLIASIHHVQARQYHFTHISIDDGLSHNDITDIMQDNDGFMWFATRDGLNRFDGKKIKIYKHNSGKNTASGVNLITVVSMDREGTIWIGSNGVLYYNAMADSLESFTKKTKEGLFPQNAIRGIKSDSKGWVYFLEEKKGVYRYNSESEELAFYPFVYTDKAREVQEFSATALWIGADDRVWLGGDQGLLYMLNTASGAYHAIEIDCQKFPNDQIQVIEGNDNFIYLGFQYSGVIRYDIINKSFSFVRFNPEEQEYAVYVHDILFDKYSLWIATEKGLYIYDEMKNSATHLQRDYFDPLSLSDDAIYVVYKDRDNGMWLGTYFGGINYFSLDQSRAIETYYPLVGKPSISGKAVREIVEDGSGCLWIGTEDRGINRFNIKRKEFKTFSVEQGLSYHNIHGMAVVDNKLYIGTYTAGLNIMDLKTEEISYYYVSDEKYNVRNSIYSICYDAEKRIWVGTRNGVYWFLEKNKKFLKVEGLEDLFVHHIYEDSRGNVWFSTINKGLICYTKENSIIAYRDVLKEKLGINIDRVLSVYEDSKGRLWLGTSGCGLVMYDVNFNIATYYSSSNGFPDNIAYKAIEDYMGNIWVGTNKGLVRLTVESNKMRVFTKNDGILCNQFNYTSAYKDNNGKLYFGTIEGLMMIDPSEIKDNTKYPPVFLTGFEIYNKEVPIGKNTPLKQSITLTNNLVLEHNQNSISFTFSVLRYATSQKNACYVMLEGFEKEWILIDDVLKVSYSNLPHGNYKLRMKSSNSIGEWEEVRVLNILISPPWWKSTMADILYVLFLLIFSLFVYLDIRRRILKRQATLIQKMEQEKERESYRAKIEFFTNIAHEIKTPLTLIKAPLEYIQKNNSFDNDTSESLSTVMKNTDRLLSLACQLLDFRRVEDRRLALSFEQTDVVLLLKLIYDRFKIVAGQKNIRFSLLFTPDTLMVEVDVENFTKIISNLFNNALNYCENYIHVELKIAENAFFEVIVENDGLIIEVDMRDKIFEPFVQLSPLKQVNLGRGLGLPLAKSLAELHGGTLALDITCVEYNRFILSLPIERQGAITLDNPDTCAVEMMTDCFVEKIDSRPTLLIVEDNLEMLDFVARKLMKKYNVLRATDGVEAMKILDESDVDMIISDIMMPNMDGFELLKIIKSQTEYSHIPIILLTAKTNLQSKIEGLELGADAYVEKPFSLDYLLAQVQSILKNRAVAKEMFHKRPFVEASMVALTKADELFLQKLNNIIEQNLTNMQFGVDTLAEKLYMSRSSLHRKIKGMSDLTPNDYIRLHRLKKAALLLQEGEFRINEIAVMTGFSSSSYFTKSFQQYFGVTPKHFSGTKSI